MAGVWKPQLLRYMRFDPTVVRAANLRKVGSNLPELTNPYIGLTPRKMNKEELARAIRQDIIAELDAAALYQAHIDATDDEAAKRVIKHIMDEEKEHIAEFTALLHYLDPDQARLGGEGMQHGNLLLQGIEPEEGAPVHEGVPPQRLTVGSLMGQE